MGNKQQKLKFKVTGSYTIQTFYSKEFEIEDEGDLDQKSLIKKVEQIALYDECEDGLLG